jgi:predicted esterase
MNEHLQVDRGGVVNIMMRHLLLLTILIASQFSVLYAADPVEEDVVFKAEIDKTKQRYILIFPKDFDETKPRDMLITLHGHGADRTQFPHRKEAEFKAVRAFASEHQMLFVSPDYRARTSWMGPKAEADVVQIISELKKKYKIERVFLCGSSMGGTSTLAFAAMHPDMLSGITAMNGTANLLEYEKFDKAISESYGGKKADIPDVYKARSAEYWPERLTMPIGLTTGGKDDTVPPHSVQRLYGVLKQLNRKVLLIHQPEGGHSSTYEDTAAVLKFMYENAAAYKKKD